MKASELIAIGFVVGVVIGAAPRWVTVEYWRREAWKQRRLAQNWRTRANHWLDEATTMKIRAKTAEFQLADRISTRGYANQRGRP